MTETVQSAIAARLDALSIPSRIDTDSYPSIVALFEEAFATYRGEAACSSGCRAPRSSPVSPTGATRP